MQNTNPSKGKDADKPGARTVVKCERGLADIIFHSLACYSLDLAAVSRLKLFPELTIWVMRLVFQKINNC